MVLSFSLLAQYYSYCEIQQSTSVQFCLLFDSKALFIRPRGVGCDVNIPWRHSLWRHKSAAAVDTLIAAAHLRSPSVSGVMVSMVAFQAVDRGSIPR